MEIFGTPDTENIHERTADSMSADSVTDADGDRSAYRPTNRVRERRFAVNITHYQ